MTRTLKLINNERLDSKILSSKACATDSHDVCTSGIDIYACKSYAYDHCYKDYASCSYQAYDYCSYKDNTACSGVGESDTATN